MKPRTVLLLCCVCAVVLWFLSPSRSVQAPAAGVEEITFMSPSGPITSYMSDAVRTFEQESVEAHKKDPSHPIYRVVSGQNASGSPSEDPTRFLVSLAGGMPPDVIDFDRYAISEWAARGAFTPLDSYLQADIRDHNPEAIHASDYFKSAWDEAIYTDPVTDKSALYGIPHDIDDRALFYNKDLLKQAGFVDAHGEAKPPRTWEELSKMAVALTRKDDQGRVTRMGFVPDYGDSWLYMYGWMNGGEFMSADGKRCTLNDPKIVGALEWMTHIYDSLGGAQEVYAFQSTFQSDSLDPFLLGKIAMKIDGVWVLDSMAQFGRHVNWGVAPPPMPAAEIAKGRTTMSWVGGWAYAIPSTARHKRAAWAFIRFLSTRRANMMIQEAQHLDAESQGRAFVPSHLHPNIKINAWLTKHYVFDDPATDPKIRQAMRVFNSLLSVSRYRPITAVGQLLWTTHRDATENAIFHKMSPQRALDEGTQRVQKQLDEVLKPSHGPKVDWRGFLGVYVLLVVLAVACIYLWDTRAGLRKSVALLLTPLGGAKLAGMGGDLEGLQSRFFRSQWKEGWLLASPWIVGFILLTGGPIAFSILISYCRYDVLSPARFIGVENYIDLGKDPLFWKSLWNTVYMVLGIPLGMALSLGIALLLNKKIRWVGLWRTFYFVPSIIPIVAASLLWLWIFNPTSGLMNSALASLGIHGPDWLQDEHTSKISLIIMGLWTAGGNMIIWLAGLKGISESYYEAASLDGANNWEQFIYVTLPMLSPYIFFNLVMGLIGTFQIFTNAFIMTSGGPLDSTLFFVYYIFNNAFRYLEMGLASAAAWVLFVIIFALTLMQLMLNKRWVHYEGE